MSTTVQLVLIGIAIFAVLFAFWPKFRQMIGIKAGKSVDGMTTAVEKEKHLYQGLVKQVNANRIRVTNITGDYRHEINKLTKLQDAAKQAQADYDLAVDRKMPESVQNAKFGDFQTAKGAVETQKSIVEQFAEAEKNARGALEASIKALKKIETQITSDEAKAELKGVYEGAAEAIEAAKSVDGAFSELKQASDQVDRELERAKARMEGAQGSDADREFERLSEDARIAEERAKYDAERNGGTKSE